MSRNAIVVIVIILAVLLLSCCIAAALLALSTANFTLSDVGFSVWFRNNFPLIPVRTASASFTRELPVDSPASVLVVNQVGEVRVHAGSDGIVTVRANIEARASSRSAADNLVQGVRIRTNSSGNQATIEVERPQTSGAESLSVELEITVPRSSNLELRNDVGQLSVRDVEGRVEITGNVGEIDVRDVVLTGDSHIRSDVGKISFRGELPEAGQVSMETDIGEIDVNLPRTSQFVLDAVTNIGEISCEFDLADRRGSGERGPGDQLSGEVGTNPQVTLTLRTNTGSIEIGY